jgi:hypothetical protein
MSVFDEKSLISEIKQRIQEGQYLAMLSDHIECGEYERLDALDYVKLLELRVFDGISEVKAIRGTFAQEFQIRNSKNYGIDIADNRWGGCRFEEHFLDIDSKKTEELRKQDDLSQKGFIYAATGGGTYRLSQRDYKKLKIETFFKEDPETGMLHPFDFRIVGFLPKEGAC